MPILGQPASMTGPCGVIKTGPLASGKTLLKGHVSCRTPWDLYGNCMHCTGEPLSLPTPPSFTPQRCSSQQYSPGNVLLTDSSLVLSHQEADLWQNPSFEFSDFLLFSFLDIGCLGLISCDFHICFHILGFSLFLLLGNLINTGFLILLLIFFAVFHLSLRGPILIFLF